MQVHFYGPENRLWSGDFDERQNKEIALAELYVEQFAHGTTGHNDLVIIGKMAKMLDQAEADMLAIARHIGNSVQPAHINEILDRALGRVSVKDLRAMMPGAGMVRSMMPATDFRKGDVIGHYLPTGEPIIATEDGPDAPKDDLVQMAMAIESDD